MKDILEGPGLSDRPGQDCRRWLVTVTNSIMRLSLSKFSRIPICGKIPFRTSSFHLAIQRRKVGRVCELHPRFQFTTSTVQIGDCELSIPPPTQPELVPLGYGYGDHEDQETLGHLRWMLQKFSLGQDIFLLGGPGPRRRRLALHICELAGLEVEYVRVTRDTTEADLKQRRDIKGELW